MNENKEPNVATNSVEFKRGVDAGLSSGVDPRNWKAGNELGQELKERVTKKLKYETPVSEPPTPLFMESNSSGPKGNAQDEKDTTEE
jgi:hypothetical protein